MKYDKILRFVAAYLLAKAIIEVANSNGRNI